VDHSSELSNKNDLDVFSRIIHLGILIPGIAAWLTGELAGDFEKTRHLGFNVHKWLGITLAAFVCLRLIYGLIGPKSYRFKQWLPFTKDRLKASWEDVSGLLRFRLPDRPTHIGLAGLVQTFGLALFVWMALTGTLMFFYLVPGQEARGVLSFVEEIHEIGEALIPIFLVLHVGAVILHALFGRQLWRPMIFLKE
jgi:cytochrome b